MHFMIMMSLLILILMILLFIISFFVSKKNIKELEKSSPFECGMNPLYNFSTPFSIQFFLIAILFMIFDVEIALIIPLPMTSMMNLLLLFISSYMFLLILLIGLIYEWFNGALEWNK
uniref:NADH-ubiquinone oxidoreductase chain 3 n=1 Tax=Ammothea calmani TaxID=648470 RepID=A0A9E7V4F7_9CHEL|nr:NADH dehydrogenase subunit 3 [Ammothea calmani]UYX57756.1 NADH dehydrogenase subunit 3 [Ammothea calmani]